MELRTRLDFKEMRTDARKNVFEEQRLREGSQGVLPNNRVSPAANASDRNNAVILDLNGGIKPDERKPTSAGTYGPSGRANDNRVTWNPEEATRQNANRTSEQIRENAQKAVDKIEERREERRFGAEAAQERREEAQRVLTERLQQGR